MKSFALSLTVGLVAVVALQSGSVFAQGLPDETLKFDNEPLVATAVGGFPGHDETSTVYPLATAPGYSGQYMADDFADKFSTPVVNVQWWGSYLEGLTGTGVKQFLVTFESDVPAGSNGDFSHPGQVLSSQIVTLGALAPGSGTYTETPMPDPGSPDGGTLYQYDAELKVPFAEQANTVYWLKIVAIVNPSTDGQIIWGWHDRDWTVPNLLASTPPAVTPGEGPVGVVSSGLTVNHFQDDAVAGTMTLGPITSLISGPIDPALVIQQLGTPQHYIVPFDGPAASAGAANGIDSFSKDLAFALYTRVPEPSSIVMLFVGAVGLIAARRMKRG